MRDWWDGLEKGKRRLVGALGAWWAAMLLYVVFPIDVLPDFIPLVGQIDDIAALLTTLVLTVFVVGEVRGEGSGMLAGFSGLVPDALKPRSVAAPAPVLSPDGAEPGQNDPFEAELDGHGDDHGIDGYRPLSMDEIRAL